MRIRTFAEFWPFYLGEHQKPATKWFHFTGTTLGLLAAATLVASGRFAWLPLALIPGYGLAWFSHFTIERNRPASFSYPLYSFIADFKLWAYMISGRIRA